MTLGAAQIVARDNPFRLPGLSWKQRYLYATANHHPLLGIPSLLLATTPFLWFLDPTIKVSCKKHDMGRSSWFRLRRLSCPCDTCCL